ncbi:MAG: hypothetical protein IPM29_04855 [Planctomycetes bacterium]|nr:hypothetical protein [Planctomycetota bacterium]
MRLGLGVICLLAGATPAQIPAGHVVVVSDHPGQTPRARLYDVDPATGVIVALPGFPLDGERPLAVAVDPVNGDVAVAVASSAGLGSSAYRLRYRGGALVGYRGLVAGSATIRELAFAARGDLVAGFESLAGTGGFLSRVDRGSGQGGPLWNGGPVRALEVPSLSSYAILVDEPATGPELAVLDLDTGQPTFPVARIQGLAGARVTGVHDLPTGAIRQVLTDDLGRVHLFEFLAQLRTLSVMPPLPAGATVAMHGEGLDAIVLGGRAHPYLIRMQVFGATSGTWQTLAGPLPGDPVDFAHAPLSGARVVPFASSCGGGVATWSGAPTIGSATFAIGVGGGPPRAAAVLALGLDDLQLGMLPLPAPMPGGCPLLVSAEATLPTTLDAAGAASLTVPVPALPALNGARAFAQWVSLSGPLAGSDGLAVWIGP